MSAPGSPGQMDSEGEYVTVTHPDLAIAAELGAAMEELSLPPVLVEGGAVREVEVEEAEEEEEEGEVPPSSLSHAELLAAFEQLQAERELELQDHIETVESIEAMETEFRAEQLKHEAASVALVEQVGLRRRADEAVLRLQQEAEAAAEAHGCAMETQRLLHEKELRAYRSLLKRQDQQYLLELSALQSKITDLQRENAGLVWTEQSQADVGKLDLSTTFERLLMANSSASCTGIGQRLGALVADRDNFEWVESSGWMGRLCRLVEDSRGGGFSTDVCVAVTSIPALVNRFIKSGVFAALQDIVAQDVCEFQEQQHRQRSADGEEGPTAAPSSDGDSAPASALARVPAPRGRSVVEWDRIRQNIAQACLNCLTTEDPFRPLKETVNAFTCSPAALSTVASLIQREAAPRLTQPNSQTLLAAADVLLSVCSHIQHHEGVCAALRDSGAVGALVQLLQVEKSQAVALDCLLAYTLPVDVSEQAVADGLVQPCCTLIESLKIHAADDRENGPAEALAKAVSLILRLSKAESFAPVFMAAGGHTLLTEILQRTHSAGVADEAAEALVNVVFLNPEASAAISAAGCVQHILALFIREPRLSSAVLSRTLDVISHILAREPCAQLVTSRHLTSLAQLVKHEPSAFAYKVAFFLVHLVRCPGLDAQLLAQADVFSLLLTLSRQHHIEAQTWMLEALQFLIQAHAELPTPPPSMASMPRLAQPLKDFVLRGRSQALKSSAAHTFLHLVLLAHKAGAGVADVMAAVGTDALVDNLKLVEGKQPSLALLCSMAQHPALGPYVAKFASVLLDWVQIADNSLQETIGATCGALYAEEALGSDGDGQWTAMEDGGMLDVLLAVCLTEQRGELPLRVFKLCSSNAAVCGRDVALHNGIGVLAATMRGDNTLFAKGCTLLATLIGMEDVGAATVQQAGLGLILEVLRSSDDEEGERTIAERLPAIFEDEETCVRCCNSGVVSHVVALLDLCPSPVELRTALSILEQIVKRPAAVPGLLRHDGLRVLVDLCLQRSGLPDFSDFHMLDLPSEGEGEGDGGEALALQSLVAGTEQERATRALITLLEGGAAAWEVIGAERSSQSLLDLLESCTNERLVELALQGIAFLCASRHASDIQQCKGAKTIVDWNADSPVKAKMDPRLRGEMEDLALTAIVSLGWDVNTSTGRHSQQQRFNELVNAGALPLLKSSLDNLDDTRPEMLELRRKTCWFLATWLTGCDSTLCALFLSSGFVGSLLNLNDRNSSAEVRRYARVALGKVLGALGDELTDRINMIRAQLQADPEGARHMWVQLAARQLVGGGAASPAGAPFEMPQQE